MTPRVSSLEGFAGRPTLRDVAREARVSIKTASRVVNGEPAVSQATAARVREAVARLGYRPNQLARSLQGRRSRTIAVMIADISNPFYAGCVKAVEEVARRHGYAVILCASDENEELQREYVGLLTQRRIDGLLLVPAAGEQRYLAEEQAAGLPMVALDRPVDAVATDTVVVQNRAGTREAVEHLVQAHGHRLVAFIGGKETLYTTRKRLQGYREALSAAGLPELCRAGAVDIASAAQATAELVVLPEPPTAIFAVNNLITVGVLQALERARLRVPEDVAIAGFDDFELASALHPRLTLVRQPAMELGRRAAELLFERLEGHQARDPRRLVLQTELVVRESCGCKMRDESAGVEMSA
jgi:LacI family transcriptional regulator